MKDCNVIKIIESRYCGDIYSMLFSGSGWCIVFCFVPVPSREPKRERWGEKKMEYTVGLSKGNSELTNLACCYILLHFTASQFRRNLKCYVFTCAQDTILLDMLESLRADAGEQSGVLDLGSSRWPSSFAKSGGTI